MKRRALLIGILALAVSSSGHFVRAQERAAPSGDPRVIPEGAQLAELFTEADFTEGAAAAPDGSIYFTDITSGQKKGRILRFDSRTGKTSVFLSDSGKANGLMFDRHGYLIACQGADYGGQAVVRIDPRDGTVHVLADRWQGKRLNAPNDLCIDREGRIYFSDPRYLGHEPREIETQSVYRIDPEPGNPNRAAGVTQIITDVEKPNGVMTSPDQKTLYVADHNTDGPGGAMKLYAYPLNPDGTVGPQRVLVDFGDEGGIDGMTVDVEGNIYGAVRSQTRPGVAIYSPEGKELAFIPTEDLPTNCCFGRGEESSTLYITAGTGLYRIRLNIVGYHIPWLSIEFAPSVQD